jgi:hypothetical protein
MRAGSLCRVTGMKPETVARHVSKEASGREAAAAARVAQDERLRTLAAEAAESLATAPAAKRSALERAIVRGEADTSAHLRAVDAAGAQARAKAMGHEPRGHNPRLLERFPGLVAFVTALVTQMGGRATERRDNDQIHIKSTYDVIAAIASSRFGVRITRRWVNKYSGKHARRRGEAEYFPISTRVVKRTLLPTELEQPCAWLLNHAMRSLLMCAYLNVSMIVALGRDDHATISGGVVTDGKMVQVRAAQRAERVASGHARACAAGHRGGEAGGNP